MAGMFNRIKSWFRKELQVIEVDKSRVLPELTEELKQSIQLLKHNPAFQYLTNKFHYEKATLQAFLNKGFTLERHEVARLQTGIHYLGYLESEVERLGAATISGIRRDASSIEQEAFNKIHSSLEFIHDSVADNR